MNFYDKLSRSIALAGMNEKRHKVKVSSQLLYLTSTIL